MKKNFIIVPGAKIAECRNTKGYDQAALGKMVGVSRQTINTWENKTTVKIQEPEATKLQKALDVDFSQLSDSQDVSHETSRQSQDTFQKKEDQTLRMLEKALDALSRQLDVVRVEREAEVNRLETDKLRIHSTYENATSENGRLLTVIERLTASLPSLKKG